MDRILIVAETQGYLERIVRDKLTDLGYAVVESHCTVDELETKVIDVEAIFLYVDGDMLIQHQALIYLKDATLEHDIPIFLTGDPRELEEIKKSIPGHLIQNEFLRPIDVKNVVGAIDEYMKSDRKDMKKTILVVDDSAIMLKTIKRWLSDKYQVVPVNSGAKTIQYLSKKKPDLVLLDYEMPIVDGKQVLGMIRSMDEFSGIPVIFLTAKGDKDRVMEVMSMKPEGYLLKTMPMDQIHKFIDDFFEKQKAMG